MREPPVSQDAVERPTRGRHPDRHPHRDEDERAQQRLHQPGEVQALEERATHPVEHRRDRQEVADRVEEHREAVAADQEAMKAKAALEKKKLEFEETSPCVYRVKVPVVALCHGMENEEAAMQVAAKDVVDFKY